MPGMRMESREGGERGDGSRFVVLNFLLQPRKFWIFKWMLG